MEARVLYEDNQLLVIDKPAGMVVNTAQTVAEETVQDWIARNFQFPISNDQLKRNGIVHRLDKETSGVLLVGKTAQSFENLQKQFKERKIEKTYVALVHGRVFPEEGSIKATLGRLPWNRERFGVLAGGREAETEYKRIKNYPPAPANSYTVLGGKRFGRGELGIKNEKFTLLELYPKTGRTHQLRVHLKSIGHPIVSDAFYAGRKTVRRDRTWCPRLFLHAKSISFSHPRTGQKITVVSKLPEELNRALTQLQAIPIGLSR